MSIQTPDDWWNLVDQNWDYLVSIIGHLMVLGFPAFETPGDSESPATGRSIREEIVHLKETRNQKLARYFHAAWGLASDAYAWSVPGWGALCDLCSEEWVFHQ